MSSFQQNVIKQKLGLLNLAAELGNVSCACKAIKFPAGNDVHSALIDRSCIASWSPFSERHWNGRYPNILPTQVGLML
jgi:hypothetical protein